jgi:hypothetical protein
MLRKPKLVTFSAAIMVIGMLSAAATMAQTPPQKMKDCLLIEDLTKERLDCFDAIVPPEPHPTAKKAKSVSDCRFFKEEDQRLSCYNDFVAVQKKSPKVNKSSTAPKTVPASK